MPLPILDNRSYQQLRDELVQRIVVYNPEWTDHNPSDPGVTLIELFAFLAENLLFRFNQIPESTWLAFLRLLQIPLRPATSAEALVRVTDAAFATRSSPARLDPGNVTALAGALPFELLTEVTVAPWESVAVARTRVPEPTTDEAREFAQVAIDAAELGPGETAAFYVNSMLPLDPSKPDAKPVDFGASVDQMIWLAALGDAASLEALLDKTLNVGFVPDETLLATDVSDPCPGEIEQTAIGALRADADAESEVVWEISTGRIDAQGDPVYRRLELAGDTTNGLQQRGVVRLCLPREPDDLGLFPFEDPMLAGTGDLPPVLDDAEQRDKTLFWLRAWHRSPQRRFGRVAWLGINAAEVVQRRRAPPEFVGTGTGQPGQRHRLVHRNVVDGSLVLEVEEQPAHWKRYAPVDNFDASREDDRHYVVDLESGEVSFGDAVQGFVPQIGRRIRATRYDHGGGAEGNVAAKAINKLEGSGIDGLKLDNPLPARGGADAESVAASLKRLPGELRRRDRAVAVGDFRELALATPGADVGRAECLPLYDPKTRSTDAAGVVSVVVWPREDAENPNAPMPDRTTLRRVCAWLDRRRLVTTELYVIPPTYVKIAVAVGLSVKPGYGIDAVRSWVERILRQYLAPLPPYGPEGEGWPLGRRVYGPELEAAALQVEGVQYLEADGVAVARWRDDEWIPGTVELDPNEVPEVTTITVVAGPRLEPGAEYRPPAVADKPIPIPTIPEEC
jgi:hypothetical protein